MIRTMPVAMMAIDVLCTDRFQRFRAVRKSPSDSRLKLIQITAVARTMPTMRESISADASPDRQPDFEAVAGAGAACVSVIVTPSLHHVARNVAMYGSAPRPEGGGHFHYGVFVVR